MCGCSGDRTQTFVFLTLFIVTNHYTKEVRCDVDKLKLEITWWKINIIGKQMEKKFYILSGFSFRYILQRKKSNANDLLDVSEWVFVLRTYPVIFRNPIRNETQARVPDNA